MANHSSRRRAMPASARSTPDEPATRSLHFGTVNLVLALAGAAALVAGYWLLARGSITAAPLLLVLGYVVLLPMAIIR